MATVVEAEVFSEDLCNKIHDMNTDSFKLYFTNTAITASMATKSALPTELAAGNGYTTGGLAITMSFSRTGNQTTINGTQVVLTASGSVGPFRYIGLYNDTPTSPADPMVAFYDHGSSITMSSGETYTVPAGPWLTVN